jgi:hypothetical protein
MKKKVLVIIMFLSTFLVAKAQFGYGKFEDVKKIKEVPLLVLLESKNKKIVKKLSKKNNGMLEQYYSQINQYNEALKKSFINSWEFSEEIKFIEEDSLEVYNTKENAGKFAFFTKDVQKGDTDSSLLRTNGIITTHSYAIFLVGSNKPVHSVLYTSHTLNEADSKFISQQIQNYLKTRLIPTTEKKSRTKLMLEMNDNAHMVKDKLVLFDKDNLAPDIIYSTNATYPFNHKVTSKEEIDTAILNNDPKIIYLKILPIGHVTGVCRPVKTSQLMHVQYFINAENGEIMSYVSPSKIGLGGSLGTSMKSSKHQMKKRDLEKMANTIKAVK